MPSKTKQAESWSQTLISVSPGEDPVLGEFGSKTKISANIMDPSTVCVEDFVHQIRIHCFEVIDRKELELGSSRDAENQTLLQGILEVIVSIEREHEAVQTMHIRGHRTNVEDVKMKDYLNRPIPVMRSHRTGQTDIEIPPGTSYHETMKKLSTMRERWQRPSQNSIDEKTIIDEILNYLLALTFWTCEPVLDEIPVKTKYQQTQTIIRYDRTDSILVDNEIQTELTCEPRYSNSKLLDQYKKTKNFIQGCLQKCFIEGVEPRIIIDDLLDEIVAKGADRFRYPMREQMIQTVASYRSYNDGDKDVLQKLRIPVVVDPLEASVVVMPLIDDLLYCICDEVSRDARHVVKNILGSLLQRTTMIGFKLAEILEQSQPKSIEQILDQRRRKIVESMLTKEKQTIATQTGLAGVPEVMKIKEVLYSICVRESMCHCCTVRQEESSLRENTKVPRTQDVLLAYNPCYVVATTEEAKNPHLKPIADLTRRKIEKPITVRLSTSQYIKETCDIFSETFNIPTSPKKNIRARDSISGWTRIIDNTLAKSWSLKDSTDSADNGVTTSSTAESIPRSCCRKSSQSESILNLQASKALQILKSTFCTRDTCLATLRATLREHHSPGENTNGERTFRNLDNCMLLNLHQRRRRTINNIDGQVCARPRINKFRTVLMRRPS